MRACAFVVFALVAFQACGQQPAEPQERPSIVAMHDPQGQKLAIADIKAQARSIQGAVGALGMVIRNSPHPEIRRAAAEALIEIGPSAYYELPTLIKALQEDKDIEVRRLVARVLGSCKALAVPAIPALIAALEDEDTGVQAKAATALGNIGPAAREAIAPLQKATKSRDAFVAQIAGFAIRDITRIDKLRRDLRHDFDDAVRRKATRELGELGPLAVDALPVLAEALDDRDQQVRWLSATSLGQIGPAALPTLPALKVAAASKDAELAKRADAALRLISAGN